MLTQKEMLRMSPAELVDAGICPTCLNRATGGGVYGSNAHNGIQGALHQGERKQEDPSQLGV